MLVLAVAELGIFAAFATVARTAGHGWRATIVIAMCATWVISKLLRAPPCGGRCPGCCQLIAGGGISARPAELAADRNDRNGPA